MTKLKDQEIWISFWWKEYIKEDTLKYESRCNFTTVVLLSTQRMSRERCLCFHVVMFLYYVYLKKKRLVSLSWRDYDVISKLWTQQETKSIISEEKTKRSMALIPACSQVCCVTRTVILRTYTHLHVCLSRHPNRIECREMRRVGG